ncbi:hypothetical protein F5B21DRAFT_476524 [Xylaria acuta]|nr:hypothetical protein F5B21DRAFT_476524 [Xylaria acuta]
MDWRRNPTPDDHRRLHVPDINWDYDFDYPEWRWPNWKFGYKADALFQSLHAEFNCIPFAIQDPFAWFCDVHQLVAASKSREEFETALRKRRDERFKEIQAAWRDATDELALNIPLWEDPQMDRNNRWNTFIELSRHFSFDSFVAHFGNYLPKSRIPMPNEQSAAAPQALEQPEQPEQPQQSDQPSPDKQSGRDDQAKAQFRNHIQGLINRLTNDNVTGVIENLTYLYQTNARQLVTSTLVDLIIAFVRSPEKRANLFFTMIARFIATVDKTVGIAVSAQFVQHLIETMEKRSATASGDQSDARSEHLDSSLPPPPPPPKETGKTRATRAKASKGPVRNGRVEKPPPKRRTTKNSTLNASEGTRRSARLQQRAARGGGG